jgi:hypothetical protein
MSRDGLSSPHIKWNFLFRGRDRIDSYNMEQAIGLLNRILEGSDPQDTVRLPLHQAELIATLSLRELGSLYRSMSVVGIVQALEHDGLFSRRIVVIANDGADFAVTHSRAESQIVAETARRISMSTLRAVG